MLQQPKNDGSLLHSTVAHTLARELSMKALTSVYISAGCPDDNVLLAQCTCRGVFDGQLICRAFRRVMMRCRRVRIVLMHEHAATRLLIDDAPTRAVGAGACCVFLM